MVFHLEYKVFKLILGHSKPTRPSSDPYPKCWLSGQPGGREFDSNQNSEQRRGG